VRGPLKKLRPNEKMMLSASRINDIPNLFNRYGFSISKSIVEEHGGHIHFSDNKPAGAILYFTLPIHEEGIPNDK
jgi:light-regulated signal transduction histidine kinase (bacteriophytochrome)